MKLKRILVAALVVLVLTLGTVVFAQVQRPYRNASVWTISFIRMQPGMDSAYLQYVATDWKREQEALKKEGQIISYKVMQTEAHGSTDWNLMLMTEYKDLATYESSLKKTEEVLQTVVGNDETQRQGYRARLAIREILGTRLTREIVLEPGH